MSVTFSSSYTNATLGKSSETQEGKEVNVVIIICSNKIKSILIVNNK